MDKKTIFSVFMLAAITIAIGLFVIDRKNSYVENDMAASDILVVNDLDYASMNIIGGSPATYLKLLLANESTNYRLLYGGDYGLDQKINGTWYEFPKKLSDNGVDIGITTVRNSLDAGDTAIFYAYLDSKYGALKPGEYRIVKPISVDTYFSNVEYRFYFGENHYLSVEFSVE